MSSWIPWRHGATSPPPPDASPTSGSKHQTPEGPLKGSSSGTTGTEDVLQESQPSRAAGAGPSTHSPSAQNSGNLLLAPPSARGDSEARHPVLGPAIKPPRPPPGLHESTPAAAGGSPLSHASSDASPARTLSQATSDVSPPRTLSQAASGASSAITSSGSGSTWSHASSLLRSATGSSYSTNSHTTSSHSTSSTESDRRSASIHRSIGAWPPDYVGEAGATSDSDALTVLKKGAAKNRQGVIPAPEFARVAAYTLRDAGNLVRAIKQQAHKSGPPESNTGFAFADTAHSVWSHHDDKVRKFHLEHRRHAQLQTLEDNLTTLLQATGQHLNADVTHAWVQQNGPGKLERLHGDIRALRESSAASLQTRETSFKDRLTKAYARGDLHACARPPVDPAVCEHVAQALVHRFNGLKDSPAEQAALANNPAWRELAAQVVHPALGFTYDVSSSNAQNLPASPQLLGLLLNVTPEEGSMKIGNTTWRLDYFKRGREERAFAARHVDRGVAAILFHETKHVKKVNGSWGQAYDVELRKAAERLEKLLPT